ncbi:testis-expressed protein 47-like isoform 9-T9 [Liasis olivaceus]
MGQAISSSLGSFLLSHCLATATGAQQAMASSQAESGFFYESDDFTFEERSSVYKLQLERLRKDGKSSSDVLYSVLRDLRDMEQQKRVLVLDVKILVMSHNLPARLFQQWNYKVLNLPERYLNYETPHEEPVEATICECLTALLRLGKYLLNYPKSPKNLPDHFLEEVPEFIVSQDTIGFLLECQELLSPAQFLHLFEFPLDIQMDSESMFSLSDRLKLHLDWAAVKGSYKKDMSL